MKKHITSDKEVIFMAGVVCLFAGLFVSNITQKLMDILMKFSGNVGNGMRKNWLNFGGDPDSSLDSGSF